MKAPFPDCMAAYMYIYCINNYIYKLLYIYILHNCTHIWCFSAGGRGQEGPPTHTHIGEQSYTEQNELMQERSNEIAAIPVSHCLLSENEQRAHYRRYLWEGATYRRITDKLWVQVMQVLQRRKSGLMKTDFVLVS